MNFQVETDTTFVDDMRISRKGLESIKAHEGLRLAAYLCPSGVPTIGYGHTHGVGAEATQDDEFVLGSSKHHVKVPGRINIAQFTPSGSADP